MNKQYDSVKLDITGMLISKDNKYGIKDISSGKNIYEIPLKYDEIISINSYKTIIDNKSIEETSTGSVVLVRNQNKWGAYCYLLDSKTKYREKNDRMITTSFINSAKVMTIFDKLEVFYIDKKGVDVYFKVYSNGKCGILSAYKKSFIVPMVFDDIIGANNIDKNWNVYGTINGENVLYDSVRYYKFDEITINDSTKEYNNIKKLIKK